MSLIKDKYFKWFESFYATAIGECSEDSEH